MLASFDSSPLSIPVNHELKASFNSSSMSELTASSIRLANLALICFVPKYIPYPNSALSSKREFAQAGPFPSALVV
ncbi:hypothetical protein D3C76_813700 [compost metagenome]